MNEIELSYISGFFDGEGSIGVYARNKDRTGTKIYYVLIVTLSQSGVNGLALLEGVKKQFGGSISKKKSDHKEMYQLYMSSNIGKRFLQEILPFLKLKREQAELGIQFQDLDIKSNLYDKAIILAQKIKDLKKD